MTTNDEIETSFDAKEVIIKKTESSKEYEQYAIAKRPPDDIGRIYLGLGSNPDKRYGYWIGRMVQRDYQDAEVVCAKRESRLAALDDLKTSLKEVLTRTIKTKSEFHITDIAYIRLDSFARGLETALAELEAPKLL